MQPATRKSHPQKSKTFDLPGILGLVWILLALLSLVPVANLLGSPLPIFTVVWLAVPLIGLLITRQAGQLGMRAVSWKLVLTTTAVNFAVVGLITAAVEPWSHTYQALVEMAARGANPDSTFAWLVRFPGIPGYLGMTLFSGLVTLFGEELFFRGWLLQLLLKKMRPIWAIILQATLFTLPQSLAALFLTPQQGLFYVFIYSWLSIGVTGGWAAWRTHSIWPSLVTATAANLVFTLMVFH